MTEITEQHFRQLIYKLQVEIRRLQEEIDTLKYLFSHPRL